VPVGAYPEFTSKIRVFQCFRGGSGSAFALVSSLYFGRLCPNYGRLCTFLGSKRASSCQLDLPKSFHKAPGKFFPQCKMGALLLRESRSPSEVWSQLGAIRLLQILWPVFCAVNWAIFESQWDRKITQIYRQTVLPACPASPPKQAVIHHYVPFDQYLKIGPD
jgi:hypothetical protein